MGQTSSLLADFGKRLSQPDQKFLQDLILGILCSPYALLSNIARAYQRMMRDIPTGKKNLILVTDISRLSRNIAHFCDLIKQLKAELLSIKEQFDTSAPARRNDIFQHDQFGAI